MERVGVSIRNGRGAVSWKELDRLLGMLEEQYPGKSWGVY